MKPSDLATLLALTLAMASPLAAAPADELAALKATVQKLEARIAALEAKHAEPTAKPAAKGPAPATSSEPFFGKTALKKLHRSGCHFGERVKVEDRSSFQKAEDAAGWTPCKVCLRPKA